ncbi:MAG TPA: hypothetical protein VHZ07_05800 [Bryobacteraceae bacterium]|nr:hypothetical protein [Bryobacteraceae bacterium]
MEQARSAAGSLEEASLQLLDAVDRLESLDRCFQNRFHCGSFEWTSIAAGGIGVSELSGGKIPVGSGYESGYPEAN